MWNILASRTLQALSVMFQDEMRLISQHLIVHFVCQINEMPVVRGALQRDIVI